MKGKIKGIKNILFSFWNQEILFLKFMIRSLNFKKGTREKKQKNQIKFQ